MSTTERRLCFPALDTFYEEMIKRSEEMKQMENYKTGENYALLRTSSTLLNL